MAGTEYSAVTETPAIDPPLVTVVPAPLSDYFVDLKRVDDNVALDREVRADALFAAAGFTDKGTAANFAALPTVPTPADGDYYTLDSNGNTAFYLDGAYHQLGSSGLVNRGPVADDITRDALTTLADGHFAKTNSDGAQNIYLGGEWIKLNEPSTLTKATGTRLIVTTAFPANAIINLVTGAQNGGAGAATVEQEAGGVDWPTSAAALVVAQKTAALTTLLYASGSPLADVPLLQFEPPDTGQGQARTPVALSPGDVLDISMLTLAPINPNQPPTGSLITPVGGATVTVGDVVNLSATATDPDGAGIRCVIFRIDGQPVATDLAAPYAGTWDAEYAGTFDVDALVIDNDNNLTVLPAATITVNAAAAQVDLQTVSVTSGPT